MANNQYALSSELCSSDIKNARNKLDMTQAEFASFVHVSVKTVERWESGNKSITGPIVPLVKILREYPQIEEELQIPPKKYPLRIWYKADYMGYEGLSEYARSGA